MKELLTGFIVDAQEFYLALAFISSGQSYLIVFTQIKKRGEMAKRREKKSVLLKN